MKNAILLFSALLIFNFLNAQTIAPNFELEDQHGNVHNLYEDYLDKGTTVFINIGASWAGPVWTWYQRGILDDFHEQFSGGDAVIFWIEADSTTSWDDLRGVGMNTVGDYVTGKNFPIFNPETSDFQDAFNVSYYPTNRLICPDGTMYSEEDDSAPDINQSQLNNGQDVLNAMFNYCGTIIDGNLARLSTYGDSDDNCERDSTEYGSYKVKLTISDNDNVNSDIIRYTNLFGESSVFLRTGNYNVNAEPPNAIWEVCNNDQTLDFPTVDEVKSLSFGLQSDSDCPYPLVDITSPIARRCFDNQMFVEYCNDGAVVLENAVVRVFMDLAFIEISANLPYTEDGNFLVFEVGNLVPLQCGRIKINYKVDCDIPLETEVCYSAEISPNPCQVDYSFFDRECQLVVGSYDPNDKRAFPLGDGDDYKIEPNTPIDYQIRFQNTGSDTAFNIFIEDIISENLDLRTFQPGLASHDYYVDINAESRLVTFYFDNVLLPDSNVNLLGSNGFVNYSIQQLPDHPNGVLITNEADIFFDFNDPVRTNTSVHEVDDGTTNIIDINALDMIRVYPNPARQEINFNLIDEQYSGGTLKLFDNNGRMLSKQSINQIQNKISIDEYRSSLIMLHYTDPSGNTTSKMITKH